MKNLHEYVFEAVNKLKLKFTKFSEPQIDSSQNRDLYTSLVWTPSKTPRTIEVQSYVCYGEGHMDQNLGYWTKDKITVDPKAMADVDPCTCTIPNFCEKVLSQLNSFADKYYNKVRPGSEPIIEQISIRASSRRTANEPVRNFSKLDARITLKIILSNVDWRRPSEKKTVIAWTYPRRRGDAYFVDWEVKNQYALSRDQLNKEFDISTIKTLRVFLNSVKDNFNMFF